MASSEQDQDLDPALSDALHAAARAGDAEACARALQTATDPSTLAGQPTGRGRTALMTAAHEGFGGVVGVLLEVVQNVDARDETYGTTALMLASAAGHDGIVDALLQAGADPTSADLEGRTALLYASRRGHVLACGRILVSFEELGSEQHSRFRAAVDQADETGLTPLAAAAMNGHEAVVQLLISKGAVLDATDDTGNTPLMAAAFRGRTEIVRMLVAAGACTTAVDMDGMDAAAWAEEGGHGDEITASLLTLTLTQPTAQAPDLDHQPTMVP